MKQTIKKPTKSFAKRLKDAMFPSVWTHYYPYIGRSYHRLEFWNVRLPVESQLRAQVSDFTGEKAIDRGRFV